MADQNEANEYVESVMVPKNVQPVCLHSWRKRHLSLPEESCVEKLLNEEGTRDIKKARRLLYNKTDRDMLEKAEGTKTGELTEDKGDSIQISESEEKDTNISQENVKDAQKTGSNKKAVQSRRADKTDKKT